MVNDFLLYGKYNAENTKKIVLTINSLQNRTSSKEGLFLGIKNKWPSYYLHTGMRYSYYCEELFLVKHKTKHSCEDAIFYKLDKDTIKRNCHFRYFYNSAVTPSVLDGGSQIVLLTWLTLRN